MISQGLLQASVFESISDLCLFFSDQTENLKEPKSPPQVVSVKLRKTSGRQSQKTDSLDSSRAACCSKLAFNFYTKALESARKSLPK